MKTKKIIFITSLLIILLLVVCILFTACSEDEAKAWNESRDLLDRFEVVKGDERGTCILVDKETQVCYLMTNYYTSNRGYMTVLVHADGTPILYENGEMK